MRLLMVLGVLFVFLAGCTSPPSETDWSAVRNADVARVALGWSSPEWVSINSSGWEDGAYISSDGKQLFFQYTNIDLFKYPKIVISGPNRDPKKSCFAWDNNQVPRHSCGTFVEFPWGNFVRGDTFVSEKTDAGWSEPVPHPVTLGHPIGGMFLLNENKAYFFWDKSDAVKSDIFFAEKKDGNWGEPIGIAALSSEFGDDDPFVSFDDSELFFWSQRPSEFGSYNIFYSNKLNGTWTPPRPLPSPINSDSLDFQPFLHGNTLFFSSDREGVVKIFSSEKNGDPLDANSWSTPKIVVQSKFGVGEPTLTADGKTLFFIQIFRSDNGVFNADILFTERK
ncbi:MAG: PD40 domain-containing protein [Candidatus Diapherotrites archaeon]|uniref:PD40 domain-containing protein n=1 Tax=Candidatus Iainarchaeum sp. TaxID=3101447 RepID=A0A8T4L5C2_9ARCH|nr:PD40 domain-containing protein [Candidatus Diapherotrites archaeon]